MRRTSRRLIAAATIFWLLFSQGAMAVHACKVQFDPAGGVVPATSASSHSDDCAGMTKNAVENSAAALCLKHCAQGPDSNNTASTSDVPSWTLTAFLVIPPEVAQMPAKCAASLALTKRDTTAPPLLLSHRLRI
jgi:hypothetical protein